MSAIKSIVIVGGTGKVAIELTRLLLARNPIPHITSVIRSTSSPSFKSLESLPHYSSEHLKAVPLSLETATVKEFAGIFKEAKADIVVFSAGAGGKPGEDGVSGGERTKKVDYEGAVKVFDAIEHVQSEGLDPRLILISAVDVRDENIIPDHYVRTFIGLRTFCLNEFFLVERGRQDWIETCARGYRHIYALQIPGRQGPRRQNQVQVEHSEARRTVSNPISTASSCLPTTS